MYATYPITGRDSRFSAFLNVRSPVTKGQLDEPLVSHLELRQGDTLLVVLIGKDIGEAEVLIKGQIQGRGLETREK